MYLFPQPVITRALLLVLLESLQLVVLLLYMYIYIYINIYIYTYTYIYIEINVPLPSARHHARASPGTPREPPARRAPLASAQKHGKGGIYIIYIYS